LYGNGKGEKLIIALVGMPNSGKTYIARKISRYLRWISYRTRAFSIAKYRLDRLGTKSAEFFDPKSEASYQQRITNLRDALEDAIRYLERGGDVAILDGTNISKDRRKLITDRVNELDGFDILWIESLRSREDADITEQEFEELKQSPDFLDREDYVKRMALYRSTYEQLEEEEGSFIKVYDDGHKLTLHKIHGFLRTKIVSYVMNLHRVPHPVYFVRHGESEFNVSGLIGGDSGLSPRGLRFSRALGEFLHLDELPAVGPDASNELVVWTSNLRRAWETAAEIQCKQLVEWRSLREIEVGVCDGLSYEQVQLQFPEEYRRRNQDKLSYRYPRGESYMDVMARLEPVIFELERQRKPLLIVAHQAVLRCLYAYMLDLPAEEIPFLSIPLHTLVRLEAKAYGVKEKRMRIVVDGDPPELPTDKSQMY
jgi:broad specificity phosphatase PhoE/adenylate kinase family enzyme